MFENLVIVQQPIKKEKRKKTDYVSVSRRTDEVAAAGCLLLQPTAYRANMDLPTET